MIQTTSVADAIAFDPNIPTQVIADQGNIMRFDSISQKWIATELLVHHGYSPIPDSFVTANNATLQLTSSSNFVNFLTGSGTPYTVRLPDASTINIGCKFEIFNLTNFVVAIRDFAGNLLFNLSQNSIGCATLQLNGSSAGTWQFWQVLTSSIASGIISYNVISAVAFNTTSRFPTYAPITGFNVTPQAGTYGVWYSASTYYTTTPKGHWWAIAKNGTNVTASIRRQDTAHSNQTMSDVTQSIIPCNGTDVISLNVACDNTGTLTVNDRSLLLIRLGA